MQPEENAAETAPQNTPEPTRAPAASLRDAKLESSHAELPPMSIIGGDSAPAAKPGEIPKPKQFGRKGIPQGMPKTTETGNSPIGAVSNPADLTEKLSGQHVGGYGGDAPRTPRAPREPRPEGEFRREDRGPREPRPEGDFRREDRGPREPRPEGEFRREDRGPREPRPEGEFRREDRGPREPRPEGDFRREDRGPREPRPERARLHIEPVVIPLEPPSSLWGSVKRFFANLWGVPSKATFTPAPRGRGEQQGDNRRDDRGGRGHGHGGERRRDDRGGRGRGGPRRGGPRRG